MTTVTKIIDRAFRASNITAAGSSPNTVSQTEALELLQSFVKGVIGNEAGDDFFNMPIGSKDISRPAGYPWYNTVPYNGDWFVPENHRLFLNLEEPVTLYLHPDPDDGARFALRDMQNNLATNNVTVIGNGRLIDGATSIVLNTNGASGEWFYQADTGNWVRYAELTLEGEMPFPEEFDDYFVMSLAMRINPLYGKTLDQQAITFYNRSKRQLQARYSVVIPVPSERGLTRMSRMTGDRRDGYRGGGTYDPTQVFLTGGPY